MRTISAFDFDGTLTRRDTLPVFLRMAAGRRRFLWGMLVHLHILVLMKLGLYDSSRAKERLFGWFFKGMDAGEFARLGELFADKVDGFLRPDTMTILRRRMDSGDTIYVISASIRQWVEPWCLRHGIARVLATEVETGPDGRLTGRFASPNCRGPEKVRRLLEAEPDRASYRLNAFGDSRGDRELLAMADCGKRV